MSDGRGVTEISEDIHFRGEIEYDSSLNISGLVEGNIRSQGELTIHSKGEARSKVNVRDVTVEGRLTGNIDSARQVHLKEGGIVNGDISTEELAIDRKSKFNGTVMMK